MVLNLEDRKKLIRSGLGEIPLDLLVENLSILNVYTGRVEPGAIGILDGRIVTPYAQGYEAVEVVDGGGRFALPGFLDTHVHIDSTLVTPENLSYLILPHGTTTMLVDPMEISNVAGLEGFKALQSSCKELPYHIFWEVSSRVPTAPGLETTGGELGLQEVEEILRWPETVSLGELDPSKVLGMSDEHLRKVEAALALGKVCNGHAVGRTGKELVAYACGGLSDDHECVDYEEAVSRLRLGMDVLIREGSTERNLEPILRGMVSESLDTSPHLMFCTDDKHPDEILREGHIDHMVNRAIALGVRPVTAVQMATINAARHFRIEHLVGSLSPGRWADFILTENLDRIVPSEVYFKGRRVASEGRLLVEPPAAEYPDWIYRTVRLRRGREAGDFRLEAEGDRANVWVIDLYPDQIVNEKTQAELQVVDGSVVPDVDRDFLKLAVVERHGKNGNIGVTFVRGFGLKQGALASSVAHDHHNIIVAGTNEADMAACVGAIERMQGGLAIASAGEVLGELPLPVAGLMSAEPVEAIIEKLNEINAIYRDLGGTLPAPFMTISFIGLPTVPELGLTDMGLMDVLGYRLIEPFAGE